MTKIQENDIHVIELPSKARLAKATLLAFLIAAVILFTVVLPAEYGFDPLGTGRALGLMDLSKAEPTPDRPPVAAAVLPGVYAAQPNVYKADTEDFLLPPGQGVEFKYHMPKGAVMVYSWKADGKVMFEFHGEPDQKPNKDYYDSYELDDKVGKDQSHGSFIAPSTGIHGWFWENKGDKNVKIHLITAGFYDKARMFSGGEPEDIPVEDADKISDDAK
jgi:hypothetical protein